MRILIDLTCLSYHMSGVERYAACITEAMLRLDSDNEYVLVFRNEIYKDFVKYIDSKRIQAIILKGGKKWKFLLLDLPKALNRVKADRYLFLASKSPILLRKHHIYNTIHDLVCWDYPSTMKFSQRVYSRIMNKKAGKVSDGIITVSQFSKERICKLLKYPEDRILVAYSAVSETLEKRENSEIDKKVIRKYNLPSKYIMDLSTLEPRKNLKLLLKCFNDISDSVDYDLVLIGRVGWKVDDLLSKYKNNGRIHFTGFVEDKDIVTIYKNALCFVFPSVYEGFGLPPVEALSLGTPVISSDAASLPEILRNQAAYFHSNNERELKEKLINLENTVRSLPNELDEFQIKNYNFSISAEKILNFITNK